MTIPPGTISEIAFLDARQIQAIDKDTTTTDLSKRFATDGSANLNGTYNLDVEQRQPLEIRATVLDISLLRQPTTTGTNVLAFSEYLLPNSGIIYASRDDALPDLSDKSTNPNGSPNTQARQLLSPTDFLLDPTRRPNGIPLINGSNLSRSPSFQPAEKGLILATNLPVYVQGDLKTTPPSFNLHTQEEFINPLASDWSNFYTRTAAQINPNFACRQGDPRLPNCTTGDTWRVATVLADAVTLLSSNFKFGFRNDGDYDLRNNNGNPASIIQRLNNGFWHNDFVTNGLSSGSLTVNGNTPPPQDADYVNGTNNNGTNNAVDSSYFNNFVTPIQRRGNFPEYVMEICRKLPASQCQPTDWVVGTTSTPNAISNQVVGQPAQVVVAGQTVNNFTAGTTAKPATNPADQRYARRVAFLRDNSGKLLADNNGYAIPLGIQGGSVKAFAYHTVPSIPGISPTNIVVGGTGPDLASNKNALWFRDITNLTNPYLGIADQSGVIHPQAGENMVKSSSGYVAYQIGGGTPVELNGQPLLVPVLQFQNPTNSGPPVTTPTNTQLNQNYVVPTKWMQQATQTTFNLAVAAGDTPARANSNTQVFESNGGLYNFVRFLENWTNNATGSVTARISGSFIQLKRSAYATAPWGSLLPTLNNGPPITGEIFTYPQGYRSAYDLLGLYYGWDYLPFYVAPNREWGFDVALLSQSPDLFAQQLTLTPTSPPNEFFREVGRDDSWIQALLCAAQKDKTTGKYLSYAVDANQLPSCQVQLSSYPP